MSKRPCKSCGGRGWTPGGWCMGHQKRLRCLVCRPTLEEAAWLRGFKHRNEPKIVVALSRNVA